MDGVELLILGEALVVMGADLVAATMILRIYLDNRRKSALMFSLAWLFDFLAVGFSSADGAVGVLGLVSITVFAGFMFAGAVYILEEEGITISRRVLLSFSPTPVLFMLYLLGVYAYTGDPEWTATAAAALGIAGVFVTAAGILMRAIVDIYHSAARYFYVAVVLFGFHLIPAALFGQHPWYGPIGFSLSATLIVLMVAALLRIMRSGGFVRGAPEEVGEIELEEGILILPPDRYGDIKKKLGSYPVLAFLRETSNVSPRWKVYFITNAPFREGSRETVQPTDLARIGELIYRYLQDMKEKGLRGVVLIDCPEYLLVYNPGESFLKFISKVRDFVVLSGGTLILIVDPKSVEERFMAQLERLLL